MPFRRRHRPWWDRWLIALTWPATIGFGCCITIGIVIGVQRGDPMMVAYCASMLGMFAIAFGTE